MARPIFAIQPLLVLLLSSGCFLFIGAPNDLSNGTRTDDHGEACHSGFASEGYCCDRACDGVCESCAAASTGIPNGTCAPIVTGRDPDDECGDGKTCTGSGACAWIDAGICTTNSECLTGFCRNNVCCQSVCDGLCMSCSLAMNGIADGTCSATLGGLETNNECEGPTVCNGNGGCYNGATGAACSEGFECVTGTCVRAGICCDKPCDGLCQSCMLAGHIGQCTYIASDTDPRNECAGEAVCNGAGLCKQPATSATPPPTIGTACSSDGDCRGGICCGGKCHEWTDLQVPLDQNDIVSQVVRLDDGTTIAVIDRGTRGVAGFVTKLLDYDGASWRTTPALDSGEFYIIRGSHSTQIIAISGQGDNKTNPLMWRFDGANWSQQSLPTTWSNAPADVAVTSRDTFYLTTRVFNATSLYRWKAGGANGAFTQVPAPTRSNGNIVYTLFPGYDMISMNGFVYVLSQDPLPFDQIGYASGLRFLKLNDLTATPLNWVVSFGQFPLYRFGAAGAPSYMGTSTCQTCQPTFSRITELGLNDITAQLNTLLSESIPIAITGAGPSLFAPVSGGVQWSFDQKSWHSQALVGGTATSVSASGGACSSAAANVKHVYGF